MPARSCSTVSIWPGARRPISCATASAARSRSPAFFLRSRCRRRCWRRCVPTSAEHAMELLGLAGKRNRTAATLSHGDQKLLDIALALVLDPKVLLLDEPTAGMGTEERWRMIDKVYELWERQKITVVFIEHDMDIVFKIAPMIVVLCYGRILATGTPDAIRNNDAVIEAYLGTEHAGAAA